MQATQTKRLVAVDALRGIAIVAVVLYHRLARGDGSDQAVTDTADVPGIVEGVLATFNIHLLMFVSGFLYGYSKSPDRRPGRTRGYLSFVGNRALRLMVPCVVVGVLDWLVRQTDGGPGQPDRNPSVLRGLLLVQAVLVPASPVRDVCHRADVPAISAADGRSRGWNLHPISAHPAVNGVLQHPQCSAHGSPLRIGLQLRSTGRQTVQLEGESGDTGPGGHGGHRVDVFLVSNALGAAL